MFDKLFVYGTLQPDAPNSHILQNIGGSWQAGTINGKLVSSGWGADMGYDGLVLDCDAPVIDGYIFTSTKLSNHWDMLDKFEGDGYVRATTQATLPDGSAVETYVYVLS